MSKKRLDKYMAVNGRKVSNFSMRKLPCERQFEIDNGIEVKQISLINDSVEHLRNECFEIGPFFFVGTQHEFNQILNTLKNAKA